MRRMNRPPVCRAQSQLKRAVCPPPMCSAPVGLGVARCQMHTFEKIRCAHLLLSASLKLANSKSAFGAAYHYLTIIALCNAKNLTWSIALSVYSPCPNNLYPIAV